MKNGTQAVLVLALFYSTIGLTQAAPALSGKSEARWKLGTDKKGVARVTLKNTSFQYGRGLHQIAPGKLASDERIYRVEQLLKQDTTLESDNSEFTITAFGLPKGEKLWSFRTKAFEFEPQSSYFAVRTSLGGDCQTTQSYFSQLDGRYLLSFSFLASAKTRTPIILRKSAFDPDGFRFLGYRDNYWSCGKKSAFKEPGGGKLELAGVITYASPLKPIQQVAVFYDNVAYNDPSSDPDSIELSYKADSRTFKSTSLEGPLEYDYWWRKSEPQLNADALGDGIYSGIAVKLSWGKDSITVPIENDRLAVEKAKGGKFYKKLVEIRASQWTQPRD